MNSRLANTGFTLIEMVVAFAILGVSLSALYATLQGALARAGHDARLSEATLVAQSLLERAGTEWPFKEGTTEGSWAEYRYELREHTNSVPANEPALTIPTIEVTATVTWQESAGKRTFSLSTLKLQPSGEP